MCQWMHCKYSIYPFEKKKNARNQPNEENSKWLKASWGIVPDSWAAMQIFLK